MSIAIFVFGVLVFLITVYGTVVAGGMMLTGRQLDEQPELIPEASGPPSADETDLDRARSMGTSDY